MRSDKKAFKNQNIYFDRAMIQSGKRAIVDSLAYVSSSALSAIRSPRPIKASFRLIISISKYFIGGLQLISNRSLPSMNYYQPWIQECLMRELIIHK